MHGRCTLPHPTKDLDEPHPPYAALSRPARRRVVPDRGSHADRQAAATRRRCRRIVTRYARTLSDRDWAAARRAVLGGRDLLGPDAPDGQRLPSGGADRSRARPARATARGARRAAVRHPRAPRRLPPGGRSGRRVAGDPSRAARRGIGDRARVDRAPGAPADRRRVAHPEPRRHAVAPRRRARAER